MNAKKVVKIPIDKLLLNEGQVEGLPANPRDIYKDEFEALVRSIKEDPEMLELRPLMLYPFEDKYVVIDGNMRLHALQELCYKEVPCTILPTETSAEELRAYALLGNVHSGDWSDDLNAEWDHEELKSWNVNYVEPVEYEDEEPSDMVTLSISFQADDFKRVKQALNRFDKDSGKAALIIFGYGK